MNRCSEPVHNIESEHSQNILNECLEKAHDLCFEAETIELKNKHTHIPIPKMTFSTCFMRKNNNFFVFLHHVHAQMHVK